MSRHKDGKPLLNAIFFGNLLATFLAVVVCAYFLVVFGLGWFVEQDRQRNALVAQYLATEIDQYFQETNQDLNAENLDACLNWLSSRSDVRYFLLITDHEGQPLTRLHPSMTIEDGPAPGFDSIQTGSLALTPNLHNILADQLLPIGFSPLSDAPAYMLIYENEPFYRQVTYMLIAALTFIFIVYLLFTLLGGSLRQRRISRSIDRLVWQTRRMAEGLSTEPLSQQPYRELSRLAASFEQMNQQLQERSQQLEQLAYCDSLTGLANRNQLLQTLYQHVDHEEQPPFAILYLDLDDFKHINDSYGHPFGDQLLIQISHCLTSLKPAFSMVSRIGGDEFVLLLRPLTPDSQLHERAEQVLKAMQKPIICDNVPLHISFSIGIAQFPQDGTTAFELLKCADMALYAAKSAGKSTFRFFDQQMRIDLDRQMYLEQALESVLDHDELQVNYQLQLMAESRAIRGFEALIRWNSRQLGYVSAKELIRVAEDNGQIVQIGAWVLRQACEMVIRLNRQYNQRLVMSVNVSPVELRHPLYLSKLKRVLKETGIDPGLLELEITEQVMIDSGYLVIDTLEEIRSLGVGLALDDFGTGYSSLAYLQNLPVQTIKIDQSFVADLSRNSRNWQMLESILHMAGKLKLFTIAEGIETKEQHSLLLSLGCDCLQGYLFCRPLPEKQLIRVLDAQLHGQSQVLNDESFQPPDHGISAG